MNILGRGGNKGSKADKSASKDAPSPVGGSLIPSVTSPPGHEIRPQLRVADRFASATHPIQHSPPYKPLPSAAASSIPTPVRSTPTPVASPPRPPRQDLPSAVPADAPTQPTRVSRHAPFTKAPAQHTAPTQARSSDHPARPWQPVKVGSSSEDSFERASSDDLHHSSSASGSLPQTPDDEQTEWEPPKEVDFSSVSSRLPTGQSKSAYSTPSSSPSRSNTYTSQTTSPFTPPRSPGQSIAITGSGYNPMAAFFGSATPPARSYSGHASPPISSPSTPIGPRTPSAMQTELPIPAVATGSRGIRQPPSVYTEEEDDPYSEVTKPTVRPSSQPRGAVASRSPSDLPASTRPVKQMPPAQAGRRPSAEPASPTSLRGLRSKNSFFVDSKAAPSAMADLPPVPQLNGARGSMAQASPTADAHAGEVAEISAFQRPTSQRTLRPTVVLTSDKQRTPNKASEGSLVSPPAGWLQKPPSTENDPPRASRIPISPAVRSGRTLPPALEIDPIPSTAAVSSPGRGRGLPPRKGTHTFRMAGNGARAPSGSNLRAAALAQSADRSVAESARAHLVSHEAEPVTIGKEGVRGVEVDDGASIEEEAPLAPRIEYALSIFPTTILAPMLAALSYDDFRSLRVASKTIMRSFESSAREVVLQRFLGPYGYRTLNPIAAPGSVVSRGAGLMPITSTRPTQAELSALRRFGGNQAGHGSSYASTAKVAAAKADAGAAGGVALTINDLHGFQTGIKIDVMVYAKMARDYAYGHLPPELARMALASTRAYNRVVLRLRVQSELGRDSSQPVFLFRGVPRAYAPVYKAGRAPMLRVWVPTMKGQSWMGDDEVVECEREVWRAGLWSLLKRGDLVHNVAVGDFANDGKLISDGKYLRDLDFRYDVVGHCPEWINMLSLPPSYFHNLIAASTNNPVFYLALSTFAGRIRESLILCTDKVQVSSPQGNYLVKRFVYRGAAKVRAGTIIGSGGGAGGSGPGGIEVVHGAWAGQVVVETEGTTEHASMLLERCESGKPVPWVVLRDKSRPDCIWLRLVTDDEAI